MAGSLNNLKIAIVHDYLVQYGGAERMLQVLLDMFPDAPVYTILYDEKETGQAFKGREIHTSFIQKIPFASKYHRIFAPLMPIAVEGFDLSYYDVVFSISASFAKGVLTSPKTKHICICNTPTRFLWDDSHQYIDDFYFPYLVKKAIAPFITYLRIWDRQAAKRVDQYVAVSNLISRRIKKYYGSESTVIYPPVDVERFYISEDQDDYFLMVGRLLSYKKFDLAIKAFSAMSLPLKIVGDGPERKRLERLAGRNVEFLGRVSDSSLPDIYAKCQALIFPQVEDFGIVPLEAMASGRPVIALRAGGALETVKENQSGLFFNEQTEIDIAQAVGRFQSMVWQPNKIREQALAFRTEKFKLDLISFLSSITQN